MQTVIIVMVSIGAIGMVVTFLFGRRCERQKWQQQLTQTARQNNTAAQADWPGLGQKR